MIKHCELSNFKSVQVETHVDLAPVTILAGANSSGKSTLLQSILVVAQTLAHKTNYPPVVLNGAFLRLGNFVDVKSVDTDGNAITIACQCEPARDSQRHAPFSAGRVMTSVFCKISFDLEPTGRQEPTAQSHPRLDSVLLKTTFRDTEDTDSNYWLRIRRRTGEPVRDAIDFSQRTRLHRLRDETAQYDVELDDELLAELRDDHPSAQVVGCYLRHFLPRSLITATDDATEFARAVHARLTAGHYRRGPSQRRSLRIGQLPQAVVDYVLCALTDAVGKTLADKLMTGLKSATTKGKPSISLRLLLEQLQQLSVADNRKLRAALAGSAKFEKVLRDSFRAEYGTTLISHSSPLPNALAEATSYVEDFFSRSVKYLGPLRDDPKSLYPLPLARESTDIGVKGEYTAAVLDLHRKTIVKYVPSQAFAIERVRRVVATGTLAEAVTDWLQYLTVAMEVNTRNRGKFGHELNVNVSTGDRSQDLTQVGVGVSQVLPILVIGLLAEGDTTLIFEQPELHLHPRVQTLLGDFFLSMGQLGKQCIVETHSEHIVSRLRLRSAMEPESLGQITKLYFVEKDERGSIFRDVVVNKYGAIPDWPKGFFDQSQREAERILRVASRQRKTQHAKRAK